MRTFIFVLAFMTGCSKTYNEYVTNKYSTIVEQANDTGSAISTDTGTPTTDTADADVTGTIDTDVTRSDECEFVYSGGHHGEGEVTGTLVVVSPNDDYGITADWTSGPNLYMKWGSECGPVRVDFIKVYMDLPIAYQDTVTTLASDYGEVTFLGNGQLDSIPASGPYLVASDRVNVDGVRLVWSWESGIDESDQSSSYFGDWIISPEDGTQQVAIELNSVGVHLPPGVHVGFTAFIGSTDATTGTVEDQLAETFLVTYSNYTP
jgi:hypothetical protein